MKGRLHAVPCPSCSGHDAPSSSRILKIKVNLDQESLQWYFRGAQITMTQPVLRPLSRSAISAERGVFIASDSRVSAGCPPRARQLLRLSKCVAKSSGYPESAGPVSWLPTDPGKSREKTCPAQPSPCSMPRIRRASWMSLGKRVTRPAWRVRR